MSVDIKDCPRCHTRARIYQIDSYTIFLVMCEDPNCVAGPRRLTPLEAIAAWNEMNATPSSAAITEVARALAASFFGGGRK